VSSQKTDTQVPDWLKGSFDPSPITDETVKTDAPIPEKPVSQKTDIPQEKTVSKKQDISPEKPVSQKTDTQV